MRTEVEARFRAEGETTLDALSVLPRLASSLLGPAHQVDESDRYLDTADGRLAAAKWACRLRSRDGMTRISLKGPPAAPADQPWHHRRPEIEGPASDEISPEAWPPSPARDKLDSLRAGMPLVERLRLAQQRTERRVTTNAGAPIGTLSLDRVRVAAGGIDLGELFVVELELDPTAATGEAQLGVLADELAAIPGLVAEPRTKLEHALERIGGRG